MNVVASRPVSAAAPTALFIVAYYGSARLTEDLPRVDLATALDISIPCVPEFVFIYLAGLILPFAPLLALRSRDLPRAALGYSLLIATAAITFLAFPTDAAPLRASCAEPGSLLGLVYALDPATNMFPSLHVALAALAYLTLKRAGSRWSPAVAAMTLAQALAVCLIKQHAIADVVAGVALAFLVYRLTSAGSRVPTSQP